MSTPNLTYNMDNCNFAILISQCMPHQQVSAKWIKEQIYGQIGTWVFIFLVSDDLDLSDPLQDCCDNFHTQLLTMVKASI